jgi:hypothetical protein
MEWGYPPVAQQCRLNRKGLMRTHHEYDNVRGTQSDCRIVSNYGIIGILMPCRLATLIASG